MLRLAAIPGGNCGGNAYIPEMQITFQFQEKVQEIAQETVETGLGLEARRSPEVPPTAHMFHEEPVLLVMIILCAGRIACLHGRGGFTAEKSHEFQLHPHVVGKLGDPVLAPDPPSGRAALRRGGRSAQAAPGTGALGR